MNREKKIKFILGLTYLAIISGFLWILFTNISITELTSYDFIKNNYESINKIKNTNFLIVSLLFIVFTIVWVLMLGFGSPIILFAGFIFGKWIGSIYAVISLSLGALFLYLLSGYFFRDIIEKKFSTKFIFLRDKFKKNEFNFFLIYRFVGGIPFFISNILPVLFNVKPSNFFFGSMLGMYPQVFVAASLGSGLGKIIENNLQAPSIFELIFSSDIYIPILSFIFLLILGIIIKNLYYK